MTKSTISLQIEMQIGQLNRAIEFSKLSFADAYYIVFSDAPTERSVLNLLTNDEVEMHAITRKMLVKELANLV